MRHILGFILAIVLAAAVYAGGSWGFIRLHRATATVSSGSLLHDNNALYALAALAGVGLLAGILIAAPRVSALATGLPGLVLIAWTVLYIVSVNHAIDLVPLKGQDFGRGFKALLADGALAAAGFAMIIPLFVPSRWRRAGAAADAGIDGLLSDADTTRTLPG